MILGEIYKKTNKEQLFVYRGEYDNNYLHYIFINKYGEVIIKGVNGTGEIFKDPCRVATQEEREYFYEKIHMFGYHYNQSNIKVINLTTKEIIEQ